MHERTILHRDIERNEKEIERLKRRNNELKDELEQAVKPEDIEAIKKALSQTQAELKRKEARAAQQQSLSRIYTDARASSLAQSIELAKVQVERIASQAIESLAASTTVELGRVQKNADLAVNDLRLATEGNIALLKSETQSSIASLRAETQSSIDALRIETQESIEALKTETQNSVSAISTELAQAKVELQNSIDLLNQTLTTVLEGHKGEVRFYLDQPPQGCLPMDGGSYTAIDYPNLTGGESWHLGISGGVVTSLDLGGRFPYAGLPMALTDSSTAMPNNPFVVDYQPDHQHTYTVYSYFSRSLPGAFPSTTINEIDTIAESIKQTTFAGGHSHLLTGGDSETRPKGFGVKVCVQS